VQLACVFLSAQGCLKEFFCIISVKNTTEIGAGKKAFCLLGLQFLEKANVLFKDIALMIDLENFVTQPDSWYSVIDVWRVIERPLTVVLRNQLAEDFDESIARLGRMLAGASLVILFEIRAQAPWGAFNVELPRRGDGLVAISRDSKAKAEADKHGDPHGSLLELFISNYTRDEQEFTN
jgi:hypothetical protein